MFKAVKLSIPTFLLLFAFLSCSSPFSEFELYFTGDERDLLIQENEVPSGWFLKDLRQNLVPKPNAKNWTVVYRPTTSDPFGTWSEIIHSVTIFSQEDDAIAFFEEMYPSVPK